MGAVGCPTQPQCVVRPRGRGHESEGWGERRSVRILCFPEVFLWSWFLLWLQPCCHLLCQCQLRRVLPLQRRRFAPAVGRPSWPCSAPCGPTWSETGACRRNEPTLQTAAPPHTSWSLKGERRQKTGLNIQYNNIRMTGEQKQLHTYLNVANCVCLSVTKWADLKFVLLLNVSYTSKIKYIHTINMALKNRHKTQEGTK